MEDMLTNNFEGIFGTRKTDVKAEFKPELANEKAVSEDYRQMLNDKVKLEIALHRQANQNIYSVPFTVAEIKDLENSNIPNTVYRLMRTPNSNRATSKLLDGDKLQLDSFNDISFFKGNVNGITVSITVGPKTVKYTYSASKKAWELKDRQDETPPKPKKKDTSKNSKAKLKAFQKILNKK